MKSISKILLAGLAIGFSAFAGVVQAAPAGEITLLTGRGTATAVDGSIRTLAKGDPVYSSEVINSGVNSYINIKFSDGAFTLLRPNSRFEIEKFVDAQSAADAGKPAATAPAPAPAAPSAKPLAAAAPATGSSTSSAFFRLLKGGFRAVSGLIGHVNRDEYRVSTPVATIGIRGTDYIVVLCDAACAADPEFSESLPPGASANGGVVVGVISGGVFVTNEAGKGTALGENQYLVNLPDGTQILLPYEPKFLRIDPIPNPKTICQQ